MTSPSQCAALVAPQVDRLRIAMGRAGNARMSELIKPFDLDDSSGYVLAMMRNMFPSRSVRLSDFERVFTYQPGLVQSALPVLRSKGLVEVTESTVRLADAGTSVIGEVHRIAGEMARALWSTADDGVKVAHALVSRALESTPPVTGAYAVLAPPHASGDPAADLAEQLSSVRFHRYDAHIDAWESLGFTVATVRELEGPERDAIEEDTNRRDGRLWDTLEPSDRETLVDVLRALPA